MTRRVVLASDVALAGSPVERLATALTAAGHTVMTLCPGYRPAPPGPFEADTILFTPAEPAAAEPAADCHFPVPTFGPPHPFTALVSTLVGTYIGAMQYHIAEAVRRFEPDVLHADHLWLAAYACHQEGDVPYVVTAYAEDLQACAADERFASHVHDAATGAAAVLVPDDGVAAALARGVPGARRVVGDPTDVAEVVKLYDTANA